MTFLRSPLWQKGFRPFFALAALYAALVIPWWLHVFLGGGAVPGPLQGVLWHGHSLVHGFTVAVIAGFLLTAVSNWTGRETATGVRLAGLAGLWGAGRLALHLLPHPAGAAIDLAFLPALTATLSIPLWRARSTRNAGIPVILLALWLTQGAVHLDAAGVTPSAGAPALRVAIHLIAVLMLLIGGRIIPLFTANRTGVSGIRSRPALDRLALGAGALLAALLAFPANASILALVAGVAAVATFARSTTWGLRAALAEPMLWILHLGHAFIGLGFALQALGPWLSIPPSAAIHALTVGGIGTLTLGMMVRVSLGHTGRPIEARPLVVLSFAFMIAAAALRSLGPTLAPDHYLTWIGASGLAWTAAWAIFLPLHLPILASPRPDGRPG